MKPALLVTISVLAASLFTTHLAAAPLAASEGQTPRAAAGGDEPSLKALLVGFPPSVGLQDPMRMTLRVTNTTGRQADNLQVAFRIYEAVDTRSRLQNTFRGSLGRLLGGDTIAVDGPLEAGASRDISVEKPLSEISAVRTSQDDGAYPVRIAIRAGGMVSNAIDTHMILFTRPPEKPLAVSLIIPLHSPSIYEDGARPNLVTSDSLEKALTRGRLATILHALEKEEFKEVPITLAPSGLLLDMLQDLADGYSKRTGDKVVRREPDDPVAQLAGTTLARLRLLASRPSSAIIPMPYSAASLRTLVENSLAGLAQEQVVETRNRLSGDPGGILGETSAQSWLLPTYRTLDEPTLSALQQSVVSRIVLAPSSLREGPGALTQGAPVQVRSRTGTILALIEDEGLKRILGPAAAATGQSQEVDPLITRQRFLADTATIMLERPGLKRAVVAVSPLDWAPQGPELEGLLHSLRGSVWMHGATVDQVAALPSSSGGPLVLAGPESEDPEVPAAPSREYFSDLREARRAIQGFAELAPPPERISDLQRRLLIAESADWWASRTAEKGKRFARAIPLEINKQKDSIKAPGAQVITLTSQTGVIPLSVVSGLDYPVDVVVRLDSDKLEFPDGNRIAIQKLESPARTIEVRTIAQATGTFPLQVQVQTSTGTMISEARLTIRSTAYNVMAVSITLGAGLFLFAWWIAGWFRRRVPRPA